MAVYAGHFDFTQPLLAEVPGVYSEEECRELLSGVENATWLPATVNSRDGRVIDAKSRDSTTAIVREERVGADLFERIRNHVPASMIVEDPHAGSRVAMQLIGVFRPVRVYRYLPGQHFGPHQDQAYVGPGGSRSLLTLMIYLNDDFEGGETDFPEQSRRVIPSTGAALWFQHMLLHSGQRVIRGSKYVLRSDVLYRPCGGARVPEIGGGRE